MNILVIAPHPDDEAIGMGGTIMQFKSEGHWVGVLYVTSGERGVPGIATDTAQAIREKEAGEGSQVLRTNGLWFWQEPDGGLKVSAERSARMADLIMRGVNGQPFHRVYLPSRWDAHVDHVVVAEDAAAAIKGRAVEGYWYEIWTPHRDPGEFNDITRWATHKRAAIRCYKSQWANDFDEAILSLNHYRGLMHFGGSGVMYAEAFRQIQ